MIRLRTIALASTLFALGCMAGEDPAEAPNADDSADGDSVGVEAAGSIGVRVPAHPLALALLRAYAQAGGGVGGLCGVAAPSANRFGRISPTTAAHVRTELGAAVPLIVDGGHCPVGIESTILDLSGRAGQPPRILRPGHITPEHIAAVIGVQPELVFRRPAADTPRVSGSSAAHYAPLTPLRLVPTALLADVLGQMHLAGRRYAVLYHAQTPLDGGACAEHRLPNDPEGYALGLYAALRDLDHVAADEIVVEAVADGPAWMAIADRLQRAACGAGRAGV